MNALFDPPSHEQATSTGWDESAVRAAIATEAEEHLKGETWPGRPG